MNLVNTATKTALVIALVIVMVLLLLFGGGAMTGTMMSGGMMGKGAMGRSELDVDAYFAYCRSCSLACLIHIQAEEVID